MVIPNLGLGYAVTSQGPLDPSRFASDAPDPSAAAGALSTLGKSISTYERVWQADGGLNQVQDLLVRFPDAVGAQVFLQAAQHSLESGEIVSSDPVRVHTRGPPCDLLRGDRPGRRRRGHHHARRRVRRPAVVLLGGVGERAADFARRRRAWWPGPSTRP